MLQGKYVAVVIDRDGVGAAVKRAVAAFQRRHQGALPGYVWCPEGKLPSSEDVQSWQQREVLVVPHPALRVDVRAGPED